jgi:hypothetical protein
MVHSSIRPTTHLGKPHTSQLYYRRKVPTASDRPAIGGSKLSGTLATVSVGDEI